VARPFAADRRLLTGLRLTALGIASPADPSPAATARRLLALQGQDYAGAVWSLGLRSGATAAEVEAAFAAGDLVRSWPFRSTLHIVAADDVGWMIALTGDRELRAAATRHRELGLDAADFARAERAAREHLSGGRRLGRRELLAAIAADGLDVSGQRGAHLLGRLAQSGVAVIAGKDTWVLLDEHVREPRRLDRDAALRELARRYLLARGPATDRDLAWWSGLTLRDVREGIAAVDDEFEKLEQDGVVYRMPPGLVEAASGVHALPGFDEYLLGYTDRGAQLDGRPLTDVVPGGNGMFLPTIVADGRVVATWKRTVRAGGVDVAVSPFGQLSAKVRRGAERALERYAAHLGLPLRAVALAERTG
jgi:hypothetical protein